MNWKWFLFSFKGRINRKPFWFFSITVSVVLIFLEFVLSQIEQTQRFDIKFYLYLILLWPALAVQAKRWHDLNKSAWYILINLIPIIGSIWTLIQTGFIPGSTSDNRYGKNPIAKRENVNQKGYISGESTPYFMEILLFIVLPVGLLWLLYVSLTKGNWMVLILIVPVFIFLAFYFRFLRNKRVFKIIADEVGISFIGLLKNINSSWDEVLSMGVNKGSFQDMIEVKTTSGNFRFPIFMKHESEQYPQLKSGLHGFKWVYADGMQSEATVENCPLYIHIKNKIKEKT